MKRPIILCGLGRMGAHVLEYLRAADLPVGVADCGGVLVLTGDDLLNISAALMVRAIHPEVRVVVRMYNQNLLGRLGKAVHNV